MKNWNQVEATLDDLYEYDAALARGLYDLLQFDGDVESTFCLGKIDFNVIEIHFVRRNSHFCWYEFVDSKITIFCFVKFSR